MNQPKVQFLVENYTQNLTKKKLILVNTLMSHIFFFICGIPLDKSNKIID